MAIQYEMLTLESTEDGTQYLITGCDKKAKLVTIPLFIDGITVSGIGDYAFEGCSLLKKITFPDAIELQVNLDGPFYIGEYAFKDCIALKEIEIPYGVYGIKRGAFYNCSLLKRASIPSLASVGEFAFYGCASLYKVSPIHPDGEGVFSYCKSLSYLPISDNADTIAEGAFEHCYGLVDIVIPASVTEIEPLAFRSCYGLKTVKFEDPNGWYAESVYKSGQFPLDLSDPKENARMLSTMDFDDGVRGWFKK